MPAAAKSAKAAAAVKCKAVKTTMVGDETSAMGLGSVKAGGPIVRGQHGPAERKYGEAEATRFRRPSWPRQQQPPTRPALRGWARSRRTISMRASSRAPARRTRTYTAFATYE